MRVELAKLIETENSLLDLRENIDRRRDIEMDANKQLERARDILKDVEIHSRTPRPGDIVSLRLKSADQTRKSQVCCELSCCNFDR